LKKPLYLLQISSGLTEAVILNFAGLYWVFITIAASSSYHPCQQY